MHGPGEHAAQHKLRAALHPRFADAADLLHRVERGPEAEWLIWKLGASIGVPRHRRGELWSTSSHRTQGQIGGRGQGGQQQLTSGEGWRQVAIARRPRCIQTLTRPRSSRVILVHHDSRVQLALSRCSSETSEHSERRPRRHHFSFGCGRSQLVRSDAQLGAPSVAV